ncbi:hypothetical protein [Antarcticirhabdus aurantiaca]|uniref:Uncharacterized protein n=1 Tax=Antarcticirhabdus aurantiaca TaxID=2606717 RepID=A0ACD4NTS9_9HYPH|nr:hypothetical protein [Antarcticirhabdus aurantiaca]WAJ30095.1 hypothetical protein OXU80_07785 [Jeongeuplla avenae]
MKGYIYKLYSGADISLGWKFNDPIFGDVSTLGACVPNIREHVEVGDWVFALSGRVPDKVPYIVGGFKVDEKIDALEAHARFPDYRLVQDENGHIAGNIIVNADGEHHPLDDHSNFERRRSNYLVGRESVYARNAEQAEKMRSRTHNIIENVFEKKANRAFDIVGRWRRVDAAQIQTMIREMKRALG